MEGVQEAVKMALNLAAKEYWEKTGQLLEPTSFTTGDDHSNSPWGHGAGWKVDLAEDTGPIIMEILRALGASVSDVRNDPRYAPHYDVSFGLGDNHEGETGEVFYNRYMNSKWQAPNSVTNAPSGGLHTKMDSYVEGNAWDLKEALEKYTKEITDLSATIESSQLGFYENQVQKIKNEWQKEWEKGKAELLGKNPSQTELDTFSEWEGKLKQKYEAEIDKLVSDVHSKALALVTTAQFDSTVGWGK